MGNAKATPKCVIVTTGTSIFGPQNHFNSYKMDSKIDAVEDWLNMLRQEDPNKVLDLNKYSAELNVINGLKKEGKLREIYEMTIIHSDTPEGKKAANGVKAGVEYYLGVAGENIRLKNLNKLDMVDGDAQFLDSMNGLIEVFTEVFDYYRERKDTTYFIPIGGYKSLTMLAHLMGDLNGFSSWYKHEESEKVFEIPRLPVIIEKDFYMQGALKDFIKRVYCLSSYCFNDLLEMDCLSATDQALINQYNYFIYRIEDAFSLSPFLEETLKKIQRETGLYYPTIYVKEKIEKDATLFKNFIRYFIEDVHNEKNKKHRSDILNHERQIQQWPKNSKLALYKSSRKGEVYRAIYHLSDDLQEVYFVKIWFDHDHYDRDLASPSLKKLMAKDFSKAGFFEIPVEDLAHLSD